MIEYICDGCGKREKAETFPNGICGKPESWFGRGDEDGEQHACSRECVEKVSAKTGKTRTIMPGF